MTIRTFALALLIGLSYLALSYVAIDIVPTALIPLSSFGDVKDPQARATLIVNAQNSVRTGAVTILGGSAVGVAGLVGLLTLIASRRELERSERESQNTLFTKSIESLDTYPEASASGSLSLLVDVAGKRVDLRASAAVVVFSILRRNRVLTAPLSWNAANRDCSAMSLRDPVSFDAFRALAQLPAYEGQTLLAGSLIYRKLSGCDFRRLEVGAKVFELIDFTGCYFWDCRMVDVEFFKCNFARVDFRGSTLLRVKFVECDLTMSDTTAVDLSSVTLVRCV